MNRWIKAGTATVAALAGLAALAVAGGVVRAEHRAQRTIDLPSYPLPMPADEAAVERGRYLYASRGCADCHGTDGAGRVFAEAAGLRLAGPNISPGPGNVVLGYGPADWERALRHGVKPDGRPLRVMPSQDYARLTDADVGAIAAYVRHLPPASGGTADLTLPWPARMMYGWGLVPDAADLIDHSLPPAAPVVEAVTVEHGAYVAQACIGCHGGALEGGRIPGAPPDWPAAPRLASGAGSAMARYADAESLRRLFDSGRRDDGTPVRVMPFEALGAMSDTDVHALHLYLTAGRARRAG